MNSAEFPSCPVPHVERERVQLGHGSGGELSAALLREVILPAIGGPAVLDDAAALRLSGEDLRFTTDSFVVTPRWFPGGNVGSLAVHGTINDLAVSGAIPLALSAALIVEEGFAVEELSQVLHELGAAARRAGVPIITGDTKVVGKGCADGLFITTSGVGQALPGVSVSAAGVRPGDCVVLSGEIASHGMAVLSCREDLGFGSDLQSDSQPLHRLVQGMAGAAGTGLHAMRDPTRGGLASALNELAGASSVAIRVEETAIPISSAAAAACEILGLDPLHVANEGCLVAMVDPAVVEPLLQAMRQLPEGRNSAVIGEILAGPPGRVTMRTPLGRERIVDMLVGEQLPRIC